MSSFTLGNIKVTRIEELIGPLFDPKRFFPDFTPAAFDEHRDWLYPNHVDAGSGNIIASMHAWLIQTPHHNILVDTCIGNDKERVPYRDWHHMQTPWLTNLKAAGVNPTDIDFVMCTHLHVDHVGWNTQLQDGQWLPTFPNARYIFSEAEYNFWEGERKREDPETFNAVNNQTFDDSVMPIMHLAELVSGEVELIADMLHISPAPGHTPGSITIRLSDQSHKALFTGDICHHPIQVVNPEWNSNFCELPEQAIATRKSVLAYCEQNQALMMPAHFGPGFAGHVVEQNGGFGFRFKA